jgi:hypothetical protein
MMRIGATGKRYKKRGVFFLVVGDLAGTPCKACPPNDGGNDEAGRRVAILEDLYSHY